MSVKSKLKRSFSQFGLPSALHDELLKENFLKSVKQLKEEVEKKFEEMILSLKYRKFQLLKQIEKLEKEFIEHNEMNQKLRRNLENQLKEQNFERSFDIITSLDSDTEVSGKDVYLDKIRCQVLDLKLQDFSHYRDIHLVMDDYLSYILKSTGKLVLIKSDPPQPFIVLPHNKSDVCHSFAPIHIKTDKEDNIYFLSKDRDKELGYFDREGTLVCTVAIHGGKDKEIILGGLALSEDLVYVSVCNLSYIQAYGKENLNYKLSIGKSGFGRLEFLHPMGLAYSDKKLLVCEWSNNRLQVLNETEDQTHTFVHFIGHSCEMPGDLRRPKSITVSSKKNIIVLHHGNPCINLYGWEGHLISQIGSQNLCSGFSAGTWDICSGQTGELILSDVIQSCVFVFNRCDGHCLKLGGEGYEYGKFNCPHGVCVNSENTLFVADTGNNRVVGFLLSTVMS